MSRDFPGVDGNELTTVSDPAHLDMAGLSTCTFAAWTYRMGTGGRLVCKDTGATGGRAWSLNNDVTNVTKLRIETAGGAVEVSGATLVPLNAWAHCAGRMNGTSLQVFLNGVLDGSAAHSGTVVDTGASVDVGNRIGSSPSAHRGLIAEIGVWNVALTDAEILALAKGVSPTLIRRLSLKGHWPLMGLSLADEVDLTGQINLGQNGSVPASALRPPVGRWSMFAG